MADAGDDHQLASAAGAQVGAAEDGPKLPSEEESEERAVKLAEFAARRAEAAQKLKEATLPWWRGATPLAVAIAAGAITLLGNIFVAFYNAQSTVDQDRLKAQHEQSLEIGKIEATKEVEDRKNSNALEVEKEKNKAALILQALSTNDPATARRNVRFFAESGFFGEQRQAIEQALDKYLPVLPSTTGAVASLPSKAVDYEKDFWLAKIQPSKLPQIDKEIDHLTASKDRLQSVAALTAAPWYLVAAIWEMETAANPNEHLNGDPLTDRTVHVPAGRPVIWPPPNGQDKWVYSAADEMQFFHLDHTDGLTIGDILRRAELANGQGYHSHGLFTPYLWSGTDLYTRGMFLIDAHFDSTAVSRQIGIVALLRRMVDRGLVNLTPPVTADANSSSPPLP